MSEDGKTILAGVYSGRLYLSTNTGSTWSEVQPAGDANRNWYTSSMSADGKTILAGVYSTSNGRLYLSTNTGSTWSEVQPAGDADRNWRTSSMSADGKTILAGVYSGRLYLGIEGGGAKTIAKHFLYYARMRGGF